MKLSQEKSLQKGRHFTVNFPQIIATFLASLFHIPLIGVNFAYSAILIAHLEDCQSDEQCVDEIYVTETDSSWIASLLTIFIPIGGVIGGIMLDSFGRLTVLRLSAVPGVIGWIILATATDVTMLLIGRVLNGFASSWAICATFVYISEIAQPSIRGAMVTVPSTLGSLGIAITYILGYFLQWRIISWITVVFLVVSAILTICLPQSPVWLVSKGRIEKAQKSLKWLNKYHDNPDVQAKDQLDTLIMLHNSKQVDSNSMSYTAKLKMFLEPTVYKPIFILAVFNFFVQFSGLLVVVFYAVTLFQDAGTDINPYLASMCFGVARFITSVGTIGLMQRYGRRQLMIASGLLMALSIGLSGLYTKWIQEGTTTHTWVPMVMMALYAVATMIGFLGIPLAIPSELFPTEVRGIGQSIAMGMLYALAFASTRSYYDLNSALGGSSGIQFFFAAISLGGAVYTYIFLPETHKKSLHEIDEYFKNNTVYLMHIIRSKKEKTVLEKDSMKA